MSVVSLKKMPPAGRRISPVTSQAFDVDLGHTHQVSVLEHSDADVDLAALFVEVGVRAAS